MERDLGAVFLDGKMWYVPLRSDVVQGSMRGAGFPFPNFPYPHAARERSRCSSEIRYETYFSESLNTSASHETSTSRSKCCRSMSRDEFLNLADLLDMIEPFLDSGATCRFSLHQCTHPSSGNRKHGQ